MSKVVDHIQTEHYKKLFSSFKLGEELGFRTRRLDKEQHPTGKFYNDLEFIVNWNSYDANAVMFWISLSGTPKEAKDFEYTIRIKSSADEKAGRTKYLLTGTAECLSCDLSHEDVKKKVTGVMLFPLDMLKKAAEGHDEKLLQWSLVIQKK